LDDKQRLEFLEDALAQILKPLKGVPFSVVIKSLAGFAVVPIDRKSEQDQSLIERLERAALSCGAAIRKLPIERPRPNEVGNDVEPFVQKALIEVGLKCERPTSAGGKKKAMGYPDLMITDEWGRPTYVECKIFSADTRDTSMRSFYLSPSEKFKVTMDARHILMSFEMARTPIANSRNSTFAPSAFKIVDLHDLICDMKYEFNSDNHRLYAAENVLAEGPIK
jgi:hypothetical protein